MKIAVDIDDTLNIVDRLEYASVYIAREGLPFRAVAPCCNRLADMFDWTCEDVRKFLYEGGGDAAFRHAKVRAGAAETLRSWKNAGHEIVILTARSGSCFRDPVGLSRDWLEENKIPFDELVFGVEYAQKGPYCKKNGIPVLVDDDVGACLCAQDIGVSAVLAIGQHNRDRAAQIAYGGETWKEIGEAVTAIAGRT